MRGRLTSAAALAALGSALAAAAAVGAHAELYQWQPNGEQAGPQLTIEVKADVSGIVGVQCGQRWYYTEYGGGGVNDPFTDNAGTISGTGDYATDSWGTGSSYTGAEVDFQDFHSAGPVVMTINATATPAAATGTISLKVYSRGSVLPGTQGAASAKVRHPRKHAHKKHKHKTKPKKKTPTTTAPKLVASCTIPFTAPNYYAPQGSAPQGTAPQGSAPQGSGSA